MPGDRRPKGCQRVVCRNSCFSSNTKKIIKPDKYLRYSHCYAVLFCFTGGALAEGFQTRFQEFQNFEQIFEVFMMGTLDYLFY